MRLIIKKLAIKQMVWIANRQSLCLYQNILLWP